MSQTTPHKQLPELLRRSDMADLLGCSPANIDLMRRIGADLPPSFKMGKPRYWRRADVLAWLDRQAASQTGGQQ
jgi:predicted DNA-binding transcriptional regulator AlpA